MFFGKISIPPEDKIAAYFEDESSDDKDKGQTKEKTMWGSK